MQNQDQTHLKDPSLDQPETEDLPERNTTTDSFIVLSKNSGNGDTNSLSKVVGLENQKKELLSIIDWFNHSKEWADKGVYIPRGVLLFGDPGNGKTMLIREIIRSCNCPAIVFRGEQDNIAEGIIETFKKAREIGHVIIVFDELDLLINKERRVVRALQENIDGIEENNDFLILAATNDITEIPDALRRAGRLEKLILIPEPTEKAAVELLKRELGKFNIPVPTDFNDKEVGLSLSGISCAGVKAVVNDLVLRNGFDNITMDTIDEAICRHFQQIHDSDEEANWNVAVHEAGHAVVAHAYPQYFTPGRMDISNTGGELFCKDTDPQFWSYDKVIAHIKIAMAGLLSEKVLCGYGSRGCEHDMQQARKDAYNLFDCCGYSSCWETLPPTNPRSNPRVETFIKRRKMERKIESLLRQCERQTTRYVRSHRNQIEALGKLLYEKKHLKSSEIITCIKDI